MQDVNVGGPGGIIMSLLLFYRSSGPFLKIWVKEDECLHSYGGHGVGYGEQGAVPDV